MPWNICAGVRRSTPSFEVVWTEQSRDLFQKRWWITACMRGNILYRLINSRVLQSAQFYLFSWLFWRTPSTLKIAKSSPPQNARSFFLSHISKLNQQKQSDVVFFSKSTAKIYPSNKYNIFSSFIIDQSWNTLQLKNIVLSFPPTFLANHFPFLQLQVCDHWWGMKPPTHTLHGNYRIVSRARQHVYKI